MLTQTKFGTANAMDELGVFLKINPPIPFRFVIVRMLPAIRHIRCVLRINALIVINSTATATDGAICTRTNGMEWHLYLSPIHQHTHRHAQAQAQAHCVLSCVERAHNKLHWSISHFFVQYKKHTSLLFASSAQSEHRRNKPTSKFSTFNCHRSFHFYFSFLSASVVFFPFFFLWICVVDFFWFHLVQFSFHLHLVAIDQNKYDVLRIVEVITITQSARVTKFVRKKNII